MKGIKLFKAVNGKEVFPYVVRGICKECGDSPKMGRIVAFWSRIESRMDFYCDACEHKAIRLGNYQELKVLNLPKQLDFGEEMFLTNESPVPSKQYGGTNQIPSGGITHDHTKYSKDDCYNQCITEQTKRGLELQEEGRKSLEAHKQGLEYTSSDPYEKDLNDSEMDMFLDYQKNLNNKAVEFHEKNKLEQKERKLIE